MESPHSEIHHVRYVLGFAFTRTGFGDWPAVCLIEKKKPAWQAGKLNGVGGKIEEGENPAEAMVREFEEETGIYVPITDWHRFHFMHFQNGAQVHVFTAWMPPAASPVRTTDEEPGLFVVGPGGEWIVTQTNEIINNLRWLIPMAWHQLNEPKHERMIP